MPRYSRKRSGWSQGWRVRRSGAAMNPDNISPDQWASLLSGFLKGDADKARFVFGGQVFRADTAWAEVGGRLAELLAATESDAVLSAIAASMTGEISVVPTILRNLGWSDTAALANLAPDTATQNAVEATSGYSGSVVDAATSGLSLVGSLLGL